MKKLYALLTLGALAAFAAGAPQFDDVKPRIRHDHPRLFITREEWGTLKNRAQLPSIAPYVEEMKTYIEKLTDQPRLAFKPDMVKIVDDKMIFLKNQNDQNAVEYGVRYKGGSEAARCAVLYRITDDSKYLDLAIQYMQVMNEFCALSQRSRILPEWYNYGRLGMLVAYDWLYDKLTPEQRKELIYPLLQHIKFMRKPGFPCNGGKGTTTGNYGEHGLLWFAGLATFQDGIDDALAETLLKDGYNEYCEMMDYRDEISGGTGLLTSTCAGYSFANYPWASYNFMHTLKTGAGIDATQYWTQLRDYDNYYNWMCIPKDDLEKGHYDFGWGDAFHVDNNMPTHPMYTHLAQAIHFYGDNPRRRAIMALLPAEMKKIMFRPSFPWTAFILTRFDPEYQLPGNPMDYLSKKTAEYFPSYGLMNVRSGFSPNDTFASIKAGAKQVGHQHYDELSFIIYKKGFQALDTGNRGNMVHHKAYYPQTVAHNSLLIRMPNEPIAPHWYGANAPRVDWSKFHNDGGQDKKLAKPLGFASSPYHAVTAADATNCYNAKKCKEASRIFVYVKPDYFVVYDRVESTQPDYQKVFLLHTQGAPEKREGFWRSQGGNGALLLRTLLPGDANTEIIGGPDKEFWTNGANYPVDAPDLLNAIKRRGGMEQTWLGQYRYEISPAHPTNRICFLTLLQAADAKEPTMVASTLLQDDKTDGLRFTTREGLTAELHFTKDGPLNGTLLLTQEGKELFNGTLLSK